VKWADAVPNLLIGLREGLEAGLVVSILLAAVRKIDAGGDRRISAAPLWLGVLGAVMLAGSFAAVLTFSTSALSSRAQEAVGGILSVIAVGLVTGMIFWMRRTARTLSAQLRQEVARAVAIGAGALTITAFLAVGREGLETTLFIWTAVKASGSTLAPLLGAGLGLAAAVIVCWLLYRQAVRLDLGKFFSRTAIALIVIAAGVFSYGLGDLQEAGLLSGQQWVAFDLTSHVDPNSWWVSIITGVTELSPRMTVLQVVAWAGYLVVVIATFGYASRPATAPATTAPAKTAPANTAPATTAPATIATAAEQRPQTGRWERLAVRHAWPVAGGLVLAPALVAGLVIAVLPSSASAADATELTVTQHGCAPEWTSGHTGPQTFQVDNESGQAGEINLENAAGAVVAEIETIGPATTASMTAALGQGSYTVVCLMSGGTTRSRPVQLTGPQQLTTAAVKPVTLAELTGPNRQYQAYAAADLATLAEDVATIHADLTGGNLAAAKRDWLVAQLDWERVGASYDSFGDAGLAVDGLPDGLPDGVNDPGFTGLHRLEYGLYHGQSAAELLPVTATLSRDISTIRATLTSDDIAGDPTNLPIRAHEILEDALRDHLSGIDDEGASAAYPQTYADTQVTQTVLGELRPLIAARAPKLMPAIDAQLAALQAALLATRVNGQWVPAGQVPLAAAQQVDAAVGALLESLSSVPDLLEVPPSH
jgi:high-affinity iron transporter